MVHVDALEGKLDDELWFHYDLDNDVLYLRRVEYRGDLVTGEEAEEGVFVIRNYEGKVVGLDVIDWWKSVGRGEVPDSIRELAALIEPWSQKVGT